MKVLVTGGAGFIGSNLVDRLVFDGHEVTVIDNESADSNEQFYWNRDAKNYKYDVRDYDKVYPLFEGQDVVFHLAADARIQPSIKFPLKTLNNNIIGTATVLECSRMNGIKRVVYSSTSSAYGISNSPPLKETMNTDCLTPYSVGKVCGEALCKMYANLYGMETVCFRYFNVYGERQPLRGQYAPIIGIFLRQRAAGQPMTIVGDGNQRRDFTHVSDVVRANIMASNFTPPSIEWSWGQIYNIGTGKNHSINEIVSLMGGEKINIPPRLGESTVTLADSSKAAEHLGWVSSISLEKWIQENR